MKTIHMKKRVFSILLTITIAAISYASNISAEVLEMIPEIIVEEVASVCYWYDSVGFLVDLTGDGVDDEIELVTGKSMDTGEDIVTFYVNGEEKNSVTMPGLYGGNSYLHMITYIRMSMKKEFLYLAAGNMDSQNQGLLVRYNSETDEFEVALNARLLPTELYSKGSMAITDVTADKITIQYINQFVLTGAIRYSYNFYLEDGNFEIEEDHIANCSKLMDADPYTSYAELSLTREPDSEEDIISVHVQDKLTIKKFYYNGEDRYVQFSVNGESGWLKINDYQNGLLAGGKFFG